jgi:hypothetical protein
VKERNKHFTHFRLKDEEQFDFFIYSPAKIIHQNMKKFFKYPLDILSKPLIVNSRSFHKPDSLKKNASNIYSKDVNISYKKSIFSPSKYYLKIENFSKNSPFLVQMNLTF